jgi:hypothetical protein
MRHALNAEFMFDAADQIDRFATSTSTSPVGNRDVGWSKILQQAYRFEKLFKTGFVFGWKEFEGETGPAAP